MKSVQNLNWAVSIFRARYIYQFELNRMSNLFDLMCWTFKSILGAPYSMGGKFLGYLSSLMRIPALSAAALALVFFSRPLCAQLLTQPVNLTYLAQRADVIVQGRVSKVAKRNLVRFSNIPTVEVTLEVEKMLRGPQKRTYTFCEVFLGLRAKEGKQGYQVGQRLLLFLTSPSRYGLSSPVGIEQGRFHITYNSGGDEVIANEFGNAGLFKGGDYSPPKGTKLSVNQMRITTTKSGPIPLSDLVSLVGTLTSLPRVR